MLDGISLLNSPTSVAWTGGTATVFETDGTPVRNGIHVADVAEANFLIRKHITFKNRNPVRQGNGTYSKGYRDTIVTIPIVLADGTVSYQVGRAYFEIHPEATAATQLNLRHLVGQTVLDSEVTNFYVSGSTK